MKQETTTWRAVDRYDRILTDAGMVKDNDERYIRNECEWEIESDGYEFRVFCSDAERYPDGRWSLTAFREGVIVFKTNAVKFETLISRMGENSICESIYQRIRKIYDSTVRVSTEKEKIKKSIKNYRNEIKKLKEKLEEIDSRNDRYMFYIKEESRGSLSFGSNYDSWIDDIITRTDSKNSVLEAEFFDNNEKIHKLRIGIKYLKKRRKELFKFITSPRDYLEFSTLCICVTGGEWGWGTEGFSLNVERERYREKDKTLFDWI